MPLFMSKEKEREYGIYERKEKNVAGDADIYCSCSGYRCRITPAKPINNAITITCSIFASAIGEMKLDGKIFTIVSIKDVFSPTW